MNVQKQATEVYKRFNADPVGYAGEYDRETTQGHSFRIRRQRVFEMIQEIPPGHALDIGCGPGVMVEGLRSRGHEVCGIDLAENMIRECRNRFGSNSGMRFETGKIEAIPAENEEFDLIICMGVVEYLPDDEIAIREMRRVLKPGGTVLISCPNRISPWRIWSHIFWGCTRPLRKLLNKPLYDAVYHREYRYGAYRRLLENNGFEITDACFYNFKLVFEPFEMWFPALNVKLSRMLEHLCRGPLRWLATAFIVQARRN